MPEPLSRRDFVTLSAAAGGAAIIGFDPRAGWWVTQGLRAAADGRFDSQRGHADRRDGVWSFTMEAGKALRSAQRGGGRDLQPLPAQH